MDKTKIKETIKNIRLLLDDLESDISGEVKKRILWDDNDKKRIQEILNYIYDNFNKALDHKDFRQWTIIKSLAKKYMSEGETIDGGYDYVLSACEIVKAHLTDTFCPKIYNAYDLKEKIEKVRSYYNMQSVEPKKNKYETWQK